MKKKAVHEHLLHDENLSCIYFYVLQIQFQSCAIVSISEGVMPRFELTVFLTFLLHVLTYWAEILHMFLFWCSTY